MKIIGRIEIGLNKICEGILEYYLIMSQYAWQPQLWKVRYLVAVGG